MMNLACKLPLAFAAMLYSVMAFSSVARAEATFSVYGGANFSPHSNVKYKATAGAAVKEFTPGWDGASFEMPPYWGIRATWWLEDMPEIGIALDYSHGKAVAEKSVATANDFTTLEFTDGINLATINALYRWRMDNGFTPYVGAGAGIAFPKVEVTNPTDGIDINEYQITGGTVQAFAGVDYKVNDNWSVFGEVKSNYTPVRASLPNGGSLDVNIVNNQFIFGLTFSFQ